MDPLPNGPIQVIPRGLLGLLNLKTAGKTPHLLGQQVQPMLDLLEMYCSGLYEAVNATVVAAALGPNVTDVVVPQTEVWFVRSIVATTDVLGAGDTITLAAAISYSGIIFNPFPDVQSAAVGGRLRVASTNNIIIAPPGSVFGFWVSALGGAVDVTVSGVVVRARI